MGRGPPYPPPPAPGSNAIGELAIGIGQIGDIVPFSYWDTIISQYANSAIITALIGNFQSYVDQTTNFDALYDSIWNVATATGYGLDVWGRIVGVTRNVLLPAGVTYLGFQETGTPFTVAPFGQAPFFSGQTLTTTFALSDASFRLLIYAKALANISNGTIPAINQLLLNLFPGRGNCFVADLGNMAMQYVFNFNLSPVEQAIVTQNPTVLPKPLGVTATVVQL